MHDANVSFSIQFHPQGQTYFTKPFLKGFNFMHQQVFITPTFLLAFNSMHKHNFILPNFSESFNFMYQQEYMTPECHIAFNIVHQQQFMLATLLQHAILRTGGFSFNQPFLWALISCQRNFI